MCGRKIVAVEVRLAGQLIDQQSSSCAQGEARFDETLHALCGCASAGSSAPSIILTSLYCVTH